MFCEATKWSTSSVTDTLDGRPGDAVQLSLKLRALAPMKIVALKDAISINWGRLGLFSDTNCLLVSGRTETQEMQIGSCSNAVPIVASNNFEFWGDLVLSHCTFFALWRLYFLFESRGIPKVSQSQPMVSFLHHWWSPVGWTKKPSAKKLVMIWDYFSFWDERGFWFFTHFQISKPPTVWTVIRGN